MIAAVMDRTLTAPGRGLRRDADAPQPGWPETASAPPRNPDRAPRRPADRRPADRPGRPGAGGPGDRHSFDDLHGGAEPPRRSTDQKPARRIMFGILVGALVMLGVATLDTFGGAKVPVLGTFAALPSAAGGSRPEEVPPPPATPGSCLNWTRADAADTQLVDCAKPHLFEQAGAVALTDQVALPDDQALRQLVNDRCTPVVTTYLGGQLDPAGRYRVGALKPSQARWDKGDRDLRCGLQSSSRSGALYPLTGKAVGNDQSNVQDPGTCLAIDGKTIGDPVDCSGQHAVETVGIVDLSQKFPDAFPAVGDQDGFLQPECARIAGTYAGSPDVITQKGLTVYWDNITEDSWKAGSRKVNCNLAALLPDRSGFAPVTGAVKGTVTVGGEPAAPATNPPAAGVPAPPVAPTDPGAGDQPPLDGQQAPADGTQQQPDQPQGDQQQPPAADDPQPPAGGDPAPTTVPPTTAPPVVDVGPVTVG
jgi:hypothetical protein